MERDDMRTSIIAFACASLLGLSGCAAPGADASRAEVVSTMGTTVPARWDHKPQADRWTDAALTALESHGTPLVQTVPADVETWCPSYPENGPVERKAFWVGLLSSLAKHESTWQPEVAGGGGRWFGLLQIAPGTARGYGCRAGTAEALKDGAANLSCAVRIMAVTVPRDGVVSRGGRGVAADWGPFHQTRKREDMRNWVASQPYCKT